MGDILKRCFEKHSFHELNTIDVDIITRALRLCPLGSSDVVFDVGTNAGSFVRALLAEHPDMTNVHCFEPHPILAHTTKSVYPFVTMNEICLGKEDGKIDIHIPKWSVGLSSTIRRPVFGTLNQEIVTLNVDCRTVDSYCRQNEIEKISFMKIDVEGGEKAVLEGASDMLQEKRILAGMFEVGSTLTDAGTSTDELCELLEGYGYIIDKKLDSANYLFHQ
jgi:FkbM family methyltransferase